MPKKLRCDALFHAPSPQQNRTRRCNTFSLECRLRTRSTVGASESHSNAACEFELESTSLPFRPRMAEHILRICDWAADSWVRITTSKKKKKTILTAKQFIAKKKTILYVLPPTLYVKICSDAWCASKSESKVDPKFQATFQFLKKSEEKYVVGILAVLDMSNTIRTPGTHATYALTPLEV